MTRTDGFRPAKGRPGMRDMPWRDMWRQGSAFVKSDAVQATLKMDLMGGPTGPLHRAMSRDKLWDLRTQTLQTPPRTRSEAWMRSVKSSAFGGAWLIRQGASPLTILLDAMLSNGRGRLWGHFCDYGVVGAAVLAAAPTCALGSAAVGGLCGAIVGLLFLKFEKKAVTWGAAIGAAALTAMTLCAMVCASKVVNGLGSVVSAAVKAAVTGTGLALGSVVGVFVGAISAARFNPEAAALKAVAEGIKLSEKRHTDIAAPYKTLSALLDFTKEKFEHYEFPDEFLELVDVGKELTQFVYGIHNDGASLNPSLTPILTTATPMGSESPKAT